MKRILFLTNIPSPYRVKFFDALGKTVDVTVLYFDRGEDHSGRAADWYIQGEGGFHPVQLTKRVASVGGENLCLDVIDWLKKPFDAIVVCGYSSPTAMLAAAYMRLHKIPFYMEVDGGLIRGDSALKYRIKRSMVSSASGWISSGKYTTEYLMHYGAQKGKIFEYPFSSLEEADILTETVSREEKLAIRQALGISEGKMVLSIGQFIPRKGFDVLLKSAAKLDPDTGIYIVGGEPTPEYLELAEKLELQNVHFVGFLKKEELVRYYKAADLFVLPTREDIWGLVINEAMAYGLPVITTDKCVAGLELIEDGVNGYIVSVEDDAALAEKIQAVLSADTEKMGEAALSVIRPYTIENMAKVHVEIFENGR